MPGQYLQTDGHQAFFDTQNYQRIWPFAQIVPVEFQKIRRRYGIILNRRDTIYVNIVAELLPICCLLN